MMAVLSRHQRVFVDSCANHKAVGMMLTSTAIPLYNRFLSPLPPLLGQYTPLLAVRKSDTPHCGLTDGGPPPCILLVCRKEPPTASSVPQVSPIGAASLGRYFSPATT